MKTKTNSRWLDLNDGFEAIVVLIASGLIVLGLGWAMGLVQVIN